MSLKDDLLDDWRNGLFDATLETRLGMTLGFCQRFFTPKPRFFEALEEFKEHKIVDCGTGLGLLPHELRERGFKAAGIDIFRRDGQQQDVVIMDARHFPFGKGTLCLICRPSHDGFAPLTAKKALAQGSPVMYVGLPRNFAVDMNNLTDYLRFKHKDVGEEGESLYYFEA